MPPASKLSRVLLLHWKQDEIEPLAKRIKGFEVDCIVPGVGAGMKGLTARPIPDVVLISLDRQPSNGHAVAHHYHHRKATCHVPIVFAGGDPEKVAKIQAAMPAARFCSWAKATSVLREAVSNPVAPGAGKTPVYPERPMYLKLGLAEGKKVALLGAPKDLYKFVPDLPFEVEVTDQPAADTHLTMWFVRSAGEVDDGFAWITGRMARPRVCVFYVRGHKGGEVNWNWLSERAAAFGLAQFKVLRLDATWTGVIFGLRRSPPK